MEILIDNWEYLLLVLFLAEKIIKLTPTKKDDIILDCIIKPLLKKIWRLFRKG